MIGSDLGSEAWCCLLIDRLKPESFSIVIVNVEGMFTLIILREKLQHQHTTNFIFYLINFLFEIFPDGSEQRNLYQIWNEEIDSGPDYLPVGNKKRISNASLKPT